MDKWTEGPMLEPEKKKKRQKHTKIKFMFEVDGITLLAQLSKYGSNEEIFVDGKLVSKKTSYARCSQHDIEVNGRTYTVKFIFRYREPHKLRCHLTNESNTLKRLIYTRSNVYSNIILSIFGSFLLYAILIYIKHEYQLPEEYGTFFGVTTSLSYILMVMYFSHNEVGKVVEE